MNLFKLYAIFFILLSVFNLKAKPQGVKDSLRNSFVIIEDGYNQTDLYLEISTSFKNTNIDSATYYAKQAKNSALQANDNKRAAEAFFTLGKIGLRKDSSIFARRQFNLALKYTKQCECEDIKANILLFLGKSYAFQDNYSEAIINLMKSLEIAENTDNKAVLADVLDDIGMVLAFLSDYDQAMTYFERALKIDAEINDQQNLAATLRNIGFIYQNKKEYTLALDQYKEALGIYIGLNYFPGISTSTIGTGNIEFARKNYTAALENYNKALFYAEKINTNSKVYGPYIVSLCYNKLGLTYFHLGKYTEAIAVLKKSTDLSEEFGMPGRKSEAAYIYSKVFEKLGNISLAYDYFKSYNMLSDSIINACNVSSITKLQMEYQYLKEQKEMELEVMKKEASLERKMMLYKIMGMVAILMVILLITILILYRKNERNKTRQAELREKNLELEKENLRKELDYKNKELTTNVMYQLKKNNFIWSISEKLKELTLQLKTENKKTIKDIIKELDSNMSKESWEEFEFRFNEVHNSFYDELIKDFPNLTPNELKLSAFLKLNMTTKDIGTITYQSTHSITIARHRLRTKLGLKRDDNLVSFLSKY